MAVIAFLLIRHPLGSRSAGAPERELLRTVPITTAAGDAISPVLSPDGREIAFVWQGSDRKGYDLYVQLVEADLPLRLTYQMPGLIGQPAWSPAGTEIAFERCDGKHDESSPFPHSAAKSANLPRLPATTPSPIHSCGWRTELTC